MTRVQSPEKPWEAAGVRKRESVRAMFADIASTYDRMNGLMSLTLHHRWRERAVELLNLKPGDKVLDLCCGTGDFQAPILRKIGASGLALGLDFCLPMLAVAKSKHPSSRLGLGDACQLPVQSGSVSAVVVGWGIRNVPDIDAAHREIYRTLKPGGRFASLDMARPSNPILGSISRFTFHTVVPLFGKLFGHSEAYTYLPKSTDQFLDREGLAASMESAGFQSVGWQDLFFGNICIHWGEKP